jgi:hypothetical protein
VSQFGVSAVRWSDDLTQVLECRVHTIEEVHGLLLLTGGVTYPFIHLTEVATIGEDQVWFLLNDARGVPKRYAAMTQDGGRLLAASDHLLRDLPTY